MESMDDHIMSWCTRSTILLVAIRKYIRYLCKEDGNPGFSFWKNILLLKIWWFFFHKFNQISPIYTRQKQKNPLFSPLFFQENDKFCPKKHYGHPQM
jgi:hypothetical protein